MSSTMHEIPSSAELSRLAVETARRCGVDVDGLAGGAATTSPVNGGRLLELAWAEGGAVDDSVSRAQVAFQQWRKVPAPARGALVKRFGELLAVHKDDLATADQPRGRQDHLRGPR